MITNDRELAEAELVDEELEHVVGGSSSGAHIAEVTIELGGGGGGGGGGNTPAGAWNACLKGYGFPPMA